MSQGKEILQRIMNASIKWAKDRKFAYKRDKIKITPDRFHKELVAARFLGYLDNSEDILEAIIQNPKWTREDIEAELHIHIKSVSNHTEELLWGEKKITLEWILKEYGYLDKKD